MPEQRTEQEKKDLGLFQEHKESNLDRLGKIAWVITFASLIAMIVIQLNK